jgi:hypothetical protein
VDISMAASQDDVLITQQLVNMFTRKKLQAENFGTQEEKRNQKLHFPSPLLG